MQTENRKSSRGQGAKCARVGCPLVAQGGAACRDCPGPDFFTRHHECTKCRYHGVGDPRCLICAGPSDTPSHKGASHVSIDAMPDGGEKMLMSRLDTAARPAALAMTDGEADVARRLMSFFVALELDEFALVKHLVAGGNLNTYATINNRPRQYVWKMAKGMIAKSPEIRSIVKERKQPNGRLLTRDGRHSPFQLNLF